MEDSDIIQLYWNRDDQAICATAEKYGAYCTAIAGNILPHTQDAEECVNDTYLQAWQAIPPHRPNQLRTFLGRITRNLAFNRYRHDRTQKRGGGELPLVLEELDDCVSGADDVAQSVDRRELVQTLNAFVRGLSAQKRVLFVRRYWYADPVWVIARDQGLSQAAASKALERVRRQLRAYLQERGIEV